MPAAGGLVVPDRGEQRGGERFLSKIGRFGADADVKDFAVRHPAGDGVVEAGFHGRRKKTD